MRLASPAIFPVLVFLGIVIPWGIGPIVQATVLGACDPKFGCLGGITFAIVFSVVGGALAVVAAILARAMFRPVALQTSPFFLALAGLASGLSLALTLTTVGAWPSLIYGPLEIPATLFAWFVASVVVCVVWLFAFRHLSNLTRRSTALPPVAGRR